MILGRESVAGKNNIESAAGFFTASTCFGGSGVGYS